MKTEILWFEVNIINIGQGHITMAGRMKERKKVLAKAVLILALMIEEDEDFETMFKVPSRQPRTIWQQPWLGFRDTHPERTMFGLQMELFAVSSV